MGYGEVVGLLSSTSPTRPAPIVQPIPTFDPVAGLPVWLVARADAERPNAPPVPRRHQLELQTVTMHRNGRRELRDTRRHGHVPVSGVRVTLAGTHAEPVQQEVERLLPPFSTDEMRGQSAHDGALRFGGEMRGESACH